MAGTIFPSILPDADDREAFDWASDATPGADELLAEGICPWCEPEADREFENVRAHASQAHPDAWNNWKGNTE